MQQKRSLSEILTEAMEVCVIQIGKALPPDAKKEIAKRAGVSAATVYRYLRTGKENKRLWEVLSEVYGEREKEARAMLKKAGIDVDVKDWDKGEWYKNAKIKEIL